MSATPTSGSAVGQTAPDVRETVAGYIECALWAGYDWRGEDDGSNPQPLDENYGPNDLAPETVAAITAEVVDFLEANAADVATLEPGQVGHDLYLTRNHHGAGFWDRGLGEVGERLTAAAHAYGTSDLYVGDDGKLYV